MSRDELRMLATRRREEEDWVQRATSTLVAEVLEVGIEREERRERVKGVIEAREEARWWLRP